MQTGIRNCQNCKHPFTIELEDFDFYAEMKVPVPTFCPSCRAQRRLAWRNERFLYKRTCDFSGKQIFSMYPPEKSVRVYEKEAWNSDEWDALKHGGEYDFSKSFFAQFRELLERVPLKNLNLVNPVRTEYANNFTGPKNCYLVFNGNDTEDTCYGNGLANVKGCVDVSHTGKSEDCFQGFWLTNCSRCIYCSSCEDSYDMWFSKSCVGCHDCFSCVGLRKKQYCFFNEQLSESDYKKRFSDFKTSSYVDFEKLKKKAFEFWRKFPVKYIEGSHNENVSGNYISFSKNVRNCFLVREGEHLRYCQYVQESPGSKDCYDYSIWGDNNRFVYECCASGINTNMIKFCVYVQEGVSEIEYSYCCSASSNLFGCIGVRRKQYCILNKQYEKEDYFRLVEEIKKQMMNVPYIDGGGREYRYGEFFPIEMSPIDYNQSVSFEYFPKSEKEVLREGWGWKKVFERDIKIDVASGTLDDEINNVQDDVLQKVIQCEHNGTCGHPCTKGFRIISKELSFYRRFGLPLPRLCPNCRHLERVEQRTGFVIKSMKCHCKGREGGVYINTAKHDHGDHPCENNIETCYTEKEADIVYCEACYKSEFL